MSTVAKRKKPASRSSQEKRPSRKGWFSFPEKVQRLATAVLLLVLCFLLLFAFFEKAGVGGKLFYDFILLLSGKTAYLVPLFFGLSAVTLFAMEAHSMRFVWVAFLLLVISISGTLGILGEGSANVLEHGGWIGYGIAKIFF